jgi:hypothetical protein
MKTLEGSKKSLAKSTLFYLVTTNTDVTYLYVKEKFAKTFSQVNKDFIGKSFYALIHPNDIKNCTATHTKCFDNPDHASTVTIRKQNTEGTNFNTHWECIAMLDDHTNTSGIYCIEFNITKYVVKQMQLKDEQKQNQEKRAIIGEVVFQQSHLIGAPLTTITELNTEFLDEQLLNASSSSTCKIILNNTKQLDDISKNIIKTSRNYLRKHSHNNTLRFVN